MVTYENFIHVSPVYGLYSFVLESLSFLRVHVDFTRALAGFGDYTEVVGVEWIPVEPCSLRPLGVIDPDDGHLF